MASRMRLHGTLVGVLFIACCPAALATPQVVGDEACERYEVDMASFASCEDGKVVRPAPDAAAASESADRGSTGALARRFEVPHRLRPLIVLAGLHDEGGDRRLGGATATRSVYCSNVPEISMSVVLVQTE